MRHAWITRATAERIEEKFRRMIVGHTAAGDMQGKYTSAVVALLSREVKRFPR